MRCCGQKRAALRSAQSTALVRPSLSPPPTSYQKPSSAGQQAAARAESCYSSPGYSSVRLRYTENSRILVRGPVTGRQYWFSGSDPVQAVDTRDAAALLRSGFFHQGG
jgi:hypothetical protein